MFTGIIEEKGTVRSKSEGGAWGRLTISAGRVLEGTRVGDSIAVNGVCLTVTRMGRGEFTADVMAETMRRTNLGLLKHGEPVNLERAMAADGRFGGHIVSGHVDGIGTILRMQKEGNSVWIDIKAPEAVAELIVEKGSAAVDGISLTVARADGNSFSVSVIPHTGSETTLLTKRAGDTVNLESDIIGKYVRRLLRSGGQEAGQGVESILGSEQGLRPDSGLRPERISRAEAGTWPGQVKSRAAADPLRKDETRMDITLDFLKNNGF